MRTAAPRVVVALLAALLLWGSVTGAVADRNQGAIRLAVIGFGMILAGLAPRYGILAVVLTAPLLPIVSRWGFDRPGLSFADHLFAGVLSIVALRGLFSLEERPSTRIERSLLALLGIVMLSFCRVLWEYAAIGISPWTVVAEPLQWHFAYDIGHVARDHFLVVHFTIILLEGAAWFVVLTSPGLGVTARSLRRTLVVSATLVGVIGVAQSIWHFAPIAFFVQAQPNLFRISASLHDPNTLGAYLVMILPLGVACAAQTRKPWLLGGAWSALLGYCLVQSVSRSAWAGLLAAGVVSGMLLVCWPQVLALSLSVAWRRRIAWAGGAVIAVAVMSIGAITLLDMARSTKKRTAASPLDMAVVSMNLRRPVDEVLPSRVGHWQAAIALWRQHPLLGVGVGRYPLMKLRPAGGVVDSGPDLGLRVVPLRASDRA